MARLESPGAVAAFIRDREPALLDVRDDDSFAGEHLSGSGHVPADALPWRLHELPFQRQAPLLVIGGDRSLDAARALLEAEGYDSIEAAEFATARLSGHPLGRGGAAARLWRPTRLVEESRDLLLDAVARSGRPILDLACGNGRNSVFLALAGADVIACDVEVTALERTRALARSSGVNVGTWLVDLERSPSPAPPLPRDAYSAILVLNYLHRPLVPAIREAVVPGGLVVYETFTVDQPRLFGKPRRQRFLLGHGELPALFAGFEILASREGVDAEPPRAVAALVARRPTVATRRSP